MGKKFKAIADDTLMVIEQGYYCNRKMKRYMNKESMIDAFTKDFK